MRRLVFALLGYLSLTILALHAAAPPQDQYLQLYLLLQEAEKLESDGQKASAYARYDEVLKRLDGLKKQFPDWEPAIVNYRTKYTKEKLSSLEGAKDTKPASEASSTPAGSSAETAPSVTPAPIYSSPVVASSDEVSSLKKRINALESELDDTKKQLSSARSELSTLRNKLEYTEKQLANSKANNVDEKVAVLLEENKKLKDRLSAAEDQVKTLQSSSADKAVPMLQAQLKAVQEQLAIQTRQNEEFRQTNTDLKRQLEDAQRKIASGGDGSLARENDMLKGIVNRMLVEQARRDTAKRLAAEELDTLKIKSEVLRRQIDLLGQPLVALSEEERALLRAPASIEINPGTSPTFSAPLTASTGTDPVPGSTVPAPTSPAQVVDPSTLPPATPDISQASGSSPSTPSTAPTPTPAPADYRSKPRVPEDMRSVAAEASDLFANKKYDEASAKYQSIIDKYPESLYAWSNLGVVRFQQQNYSEAEKALAKAVKLSPNDAFSHSVLGIVYYQLGKYDDAVTTLTRAAALDPNDPKTRNFLGTACAQKGWQEAAEQELKKAIELEPKYGDAHFNLAVVYATQKPPAKELGRQHYKSALDLGVPKDPSLEKLLE